MKINVVGGQVAPAHKLSGNIRKYLEILGNMSAFTHKASIHMGILKSAFYSAKIEGNTLTIDEAVEHLNKLMAKSLPW